jgi:sugar phosphate isomerase/epimerase
VIDLATELGIQSWTFRGFKENEKVVDFLRECGVNRVELSSAHADFAAANTFDRIIGIYRQAGIQIVSIGVQGLRGDMAREEKYFEFVRRAGAKYMSVDFAVDSVPGSFRVAEKLAEKYDVRLAIHNHGGRHWLGSVQMLRQVFATTGERIGLCLDTAWAIDSNEDPAKMAEEFAPQLYGLHLKDFAYDRARKFKDVAPGTGCLNLPALVAALRKINFSGFAVIEYEGEPENPLPAVKECVEAVRRTACG